VAEDLLKIIEAAGGTFKKFASSKGGIFKGPCPWCGGRDRFSIYPNDKDGWYICNQCKKRGDAVEFFSDYHGMSFRKACIAAGCPEKLKDLDQNNPVQQTPAPENARARVDHDKWEPRAITPPSESWVTKSEIILYSSYKFLLSGQGKKHRDYLNARGITNETIMKARLGYNQVPVQYSYESFGLPPEKDRDGKERTVWIPAGVIIPYYNDSGLVRIRIRNENPHGKSRYVLLTGGTTEFFIYPGCSDSKKTMIVESELDGWLMWQEAGDDINIMALGNSTTRPDTEAHKILSECPGILSALDSDDAGLIETSWWGKHYKTTLWPVPKGKDPGEAFVLGVDLGSWARAWVEYKQDAEKKTVLKEEEYFFEEPAPITEEAFENIETKQEPGPEAGTTAQFEPGRTITVRHISEVVRCRDGEVCIHSEKGRCLVSGEYLLKTRVCPKNKWWIMADDEGIFEQVIRGYGKI